MHKRRLDVSQDIIQQYNTATHGQKNEIESLEIDYKRRIVLILQDILQQYNITINNSNDKLLQEELFNNAILDLKVQYQICKKKKRMKHMHANDACKYCKI